MKGAIIGDIIGSAYEFANTNRKDFQLFSSDSYFTDDSVMTCAVARAILDGCKDVTGTLQRIGMMYPDCGYGAKFYWWVRSKNPEPYNSYGNGSAMRVSAAGFAGNTLDEVKALSKAVTEVSHNHPEGLKGAECTAVCIFLARQGKSKKEIKKYVVDNYYELGMTCEYYRRVQNMCHGKEICQVSVPQALTCFFESTDFEDCIRNCISIGGDSDTIAAIAGGIAEAFYGIPDEIWLEAKGYLDNTLLGIVDEFYAKMVKVSLKDALAIAKTYAGGINHCVEYADAYVFADKDSDDIGGPFPIVIMKKDGSRMTMPEYIESSESPDILNDMDI